MIRLVNMPFGSLTRPSLALGLIQAQLTAAGMAVRTHNLSFDFARLIGFGGYEGIAHFKGVETQVGEWLFAEAAWRRPFGPDEESFLRLCGEELGTLAKVPDPVAWLRKIRREVVGMFLEHAYCRVVEGGVPRVVGFSCMFFQTIASLALGRLLKERHPSIKVVYGGACFHGEMGEELFRAAPWIDAVSTGEADDVIVPLFQALAAGEVPRGLQGIFARGPGGEIVSGPPSEPVSVEALEAQPVPDFDAFFQDAATFRLDQAPSWQERVTLPFEGSRGCFWGQKKHCTFCGLNADGMAFRQKSAAAVLRTMRALSSKYAFRHLQATDNILGMSAWKDLLPALAKEPLLSAGRKVEVFYEVKPNLTRDQIQAVADAGVKYIQPGIESFSSHVLKLMDKGVTALQNAFLLKCATQYGVVVYWNLLLRVPGETAEDYTFMEDWLPKMVHLRPPSGGAPKIELHRYSPYHFRRGQYTEGVKAARWYGGLFPKDTVDLDKVAYYFDAAWKETLGDPAYDGVVTVILDWMRRWREQPEAPRLTMRPTEDGGLTIDDTRGPEPACYTLTCEQARVYRAIDDIASPRRVRELLSGDGAPSEEEIRGISRAFVEQGIALEENDRFLGLALPASVTEPTVERRRVQMRRIANQAPAAARLASRRLPLVV